MSEYNKYKSLGSGLTENATEEQLLRYLSYYSIWNRVLPKTSLVRFIERLKNKIKQQQKTALEQQERIIFLTQQLKKYENENDKLFGRDSDANKARLHL